MSQAVQEEWNVAFTYVQSEESAQAMISEVPESLRSRVRAYRLDVRDSDAVDRVSDQVLEDFDAVDAVVCNAGISLNGLAYSFSDEQWKTVIDTNLTGSFYVTRAFLPALISQETGRIVMISSVSAGGATGQAAYAASKAGLVGLALTLAKEYGSKGVSTNTVVPGFFETDMTRETMSPELREYATTYYPLRRLGKLDEVAKVVLFLIGDGGGYINGDTIRVTGGMDWVV